MCYNAAHCAANTHTSFTVLFTSTAALHSPLYIYQLNVCLTPFYLNRLLIGMLHSSVVLAFIVCYSHLKLIIVSWWCHASYAVDAFNRLIGAFTQTDKVPHCSHWAGGTWWFWYWQKEVWVRWLGDNADNKNNSNLCGFFFLSSMGNSGV